MTTTLHNRDSITEPATTQDQITPPKVPSTSLRISVPIPTRLLSLAGIERFSNSFPSNSVTTRLTFSKQKQSATVLNFVELENGREHPTSAPCTETIRSTAPGPPGKQLENGREHSPFRITYPITIRFSSLSSEFSFQVARLFERSSQKKD
jgi:hypothetical protein